MNTISREELKERLDAKENLKLVMTMSEWAFNASHIPGSIRISSLEEAALLEPEDAIVVYCSDPNCLASRQAYRILEQRGFKNVRLYAEGLAGWQAAGYTLEGTSVAERGMSHD